MRITLNSVAAIIVMGLLFVGRSTVSGQEELTGTPAEICEAATPAAEPDAREYEAPEEALEAGVDYRAVFCTGAGAVYVDLFENTTPQTVNSFVFLAQNGYYNNTTFHRVLENFMAQGGDPTATGRGGPGYQVNDEFVGFLRFDRPGLLAMANANRPDQGIFNTNGSQFFITTTVTDHLNFRHTIFGEVLTGQENVENIQLRDPETAQEQGEALDTVVIITDPANVEADYTIPEPATQEEILAAIEELPELPGLALAEEATGALSTDDLVADAADDVQDQLAAYLEEHGHQYSVSIAHTNADCNLDEAPFGEIGYSIHVFATPEDAAAAVGDDNLPVLITGRADYEELEDTEISTQVYAVETTTCETQANRAWTYRHTGRFITVAEIVLPVENEFGPDLWLDQVVRLRVYEMIFADVLRREIAR